MPLRAFGDIRFKWSVDDLKTIGRLLDLPPNYPITPNFYASPPYLISTPQIVWRPLMPLRDHFLVLASDGLWDMLTPDDAIQVVTQHWYDYSGVSFYLIFKLLNCFFFICCTKNLYELQEF